MTALFNFESLLIVIVLFICTSTYLYDLMPSLVDRWRNTPVGSFVWKAARIGQRLSPYVSLCCVALAVKLLFGL